MLKETKSLLQKAKNNQMSLLTILNDVPLYSTEAEATAWGSSRNLTGFHTHQYNSVTGYMGGTTHIQAISLNVNIEMPVANLQIQTNTNQNSEY